MLLRAIVGVLLTVVILALAGKRQRWQEWKKAGRPKRTKVQPVDPGDEPIIRRHVDVAAPLPFRCTAPRSVFELGGAA